MAKTKGNTVNKSVKTIDFEGVETFKICQPGIHLAKITAYEFKKSANNNPVVKITLEVLKGSEGATLNETFNINGKGLFKLKGFLLALGIKVPDGKLKVDFEKLISKQVTIRTDEEEYTNAESEEKTRSSIEDYFPKADYSIRSTKASDAVDDEESEEEDDFEDDDDFGDEEDEDDLDEDEDDDFDDEDDEDEAPVKPKKKSTKKSKKAVVEEDEDDFEDDFDDDDDEDEDEDEDDDDDDEDEDDEESTDGYTEAELKKMTESELRKVCKELGIKVAKTEKGNVSISKTRDRILKKQG